VIRTWARQQCHVVRAQQFEVAPGVAEIRTSSGIPAFLLSKYALYDSSTPQVWMRLQHPFCFVSTQSEFFRP
jgi:hypothetical protein